MNWLQAIILGIVQGLTEFLPVSSSAHVMVAGRLMFSSPEPTWMTAFSAIIQLGTMLAVLIYFLRDIWRILKAWFLSIIGKVPHSDPDARMGWFVIVGTIPIGILGIALQSYINTKFRNLWVTVAMLLIVGIILWVADIYTARLSRQSDVEIEDSHVVSVDGEFKARRGFSVTEESNWETAIHPVVIDDAEPEPQPRGLRSLKDMTWTHAIIFGLAQALALIPGVSRSGATTSAGLFLGYDRPSAARYSFLLSIPAVWASGLYELKGLSTDGLPMVPTLVATVISFVVGFAVIAWLLRFISNHTFQGFAIYRIILAVVLAGMLLLGIISAV